MFATLSDLLYYLTGIYLPLPIQTFGFFMALSFAGAYITTSRELQRKELQGLLKTATRTEVQHARVTPTQYGIQILIGAILGYKVLYMLLHYSEFVSNTQGFILSGKGDVLGALLGGALAGYLKYREDQEAAKHKPKTVTLTVHPHEHMTQILFIAGITGLLGAKIFHNLENLNEFSRDPIGALLSFSGLTFYGGLIVAAFSVIYYTRKQGIPTLHMIDAAAPGLMLAYAIGRVGCQLSGDGDWGIVNMMPQPEWLTFLPEWTWGFTYPHNVINEGVPIAGCEGSHCFELPLPVFPTPFYEVLMSGLLFVLLWNIRKRLTIPGMLFSVYLVVNGIERFFIEKIRINTTYTIFEKHITQAELISSAFIITGTVALIYLWQKNKKTA